MSEHCSPPERSTVGRAACREGLRVLIADADEDTVVSTAVLLNLHGHDVRIARDGLAALAAWQADRPDVLLTELRLPKVSGCEVGRQVVAERPGKTPLVVAVTGVGGEEGRKRSADAGFDLHLVKPVDPAQLLALLSRFRQVLHG